MVTHRTDAGLPRQAAVCAASRDVAQAEASEAREVAADASAVAHTIREHMGAQLSAMAEYSAREVAAHDEHAEESARAAAEVVAEERSAAGAAALRTAMLDTALCEVRDRLDALAEASAALHQARDETRTRCFAQMPSRDELAMRACARPRRARRAMLPTSRAAPRRSGRC